MRPIDYTKRGPAGWTGDYAIEMFGQLIFDSRYGERIFRLLDNPNLCKVVMREDDAGGDKPNCWGSLAHVQDTEDLIIQQFLSDGNSLDDFRCAKGDYICLPGNSAPGYIGMGPFVSFLKTSERVAEVENFTPDSIIAFYWETRMDGEGGGVSIFEQRHAGLCLGRENGNDVFFHQKGIGEDFGVDIVELYKGDKSEKVQATMEERYFMYSEKQ